jgi:superoxide dismutase, Cu-Zn family
MRVTAAAVALSLLTIPVLAKSNPVVVPLKTSTGEDAGTASFTESGKNVVIKLKLKNLPIGDHAVHIHQNPKCDPPDFKTAGAHFNPAGKQHGTLNPMGHHNGDLPQNITIGSEHTGEATFKINYLSLDPAASDSLFANGGTSIMVHEKPDDMKTDPTGNAGNRIACGVITAPAP